MIVEQKLGVHGCKSLVLFKPELYDGHPPLDFISYHTRLRVLDTNVCAVSTAISLQNYTSESMSFAEPVQVHVANAIESFFSSRKVRISPVEQEPKAIAIGNRRASLGFNNDDPAGAIQFTLGDSHSMSSYASVQMVHIASNISCFFSNDDAGVARATIAAAAFVAPDYAFEEIYISSRFRDTFTSEEFSQYRSLLASVNLKLREEPQHV